MECRGPLALHKAVQGEPRQDKRNIATDEFTSTCSAGANKHRHKNDRKVWYRWLAVPVLQKGQTPTALRGRHKRQQRSAKGIETINGAQKKKIIPQR